MSVCQRCGVSAWHPEVHACTFVDCEVRRVQPAQQPARHFDADSFWRRVESVSVHSGYAGAAK